MEAYIPSTNTWTAVASMPTARAYLWAASASSDGRIVAGGGGNAISGYLATVDVYVPSTNTWSAAASMPTARGGCQGEPGADGRIYVIGGRAGGNSLATVEAYTP